ncbi:MAG: hypothetical protein OSJ56_13680 [Prevotella sp.]|nr:hypothetical protein [Prevotella sp.]
MPTTQEGGTSLSRLVDCFQAVSGRAVVKAFIRQRRKRTRRNGRESQRWHQRSRCRSSEALPVLGVPQLPIGRRLSKGVSARTVTF